MDQSNVRTGGSRYTLCKAAELFQRHAHIHVHAAQARGARGARGRGKGRGGRGGGAHPDFPKRTTKKKEKVASDPDVRGALIHIPQRPMPNAPGAASWLTGNTCAGEGGCQ